MKAPVNTKTRKPENSKTGGINLWTRKRRKRENGENAKTAKTRKPRKRGKRENGENRKRENGENDESPKTAKSVPVFWFSISRFLVFSVFSVFWFSRFLVFSFRWPHPSGQVAFFMCLEFSLTHVFFWKCLEKVVVIRLCFITIAIAHPKNPSTVRNKIPNNGSKTIDTHLKFNIAPEKLPSQKESNLIIFQGRAVTLRGCRQ